MGCRVAHAATSPKRVLTLGDDRRYSCEAHATCEGTLPVLMNCLPLTKAAYGCWFLIATPKRRHFRGRPPSRLVWAAAFLRADNQMRAVSAGSQLRLCPFVRPLLTLMPSHC